MTFTCDFRFEVRPDDEAVELQSGKYSATVCEDCLELLTVHRRVHGMKIEHVIIQMAER